MSEEAKEKIRGMSKGDIPIEERRGYYNHMSRRFKNPKNLKPGLMEKYLGCVSSKNERFNLLKEFLIDENLWATKFLWNLLHQNHMHYIPWFKRVALGLRLRWRPISYSLRLSSNLVSKLWYTNSDLREAEKKSEDIYEKLPLFEIEDLYCKTEAGKILGKTMHNL